MGNVPMLDIDLYDRNILTDPWPVFRAIREAGPLVWNKRGYWMTARDQLCRWILARPEQLGQEGMISNLFGAEAFISIDDKVAHNALRNVWAKSFGPKDVTAIASFVRKTANVLVDAAEPELRQGKDVDMMRGLCRVVPSYVIAHMLGVADDMIPQVVQWTDLMGDASSGGFPIDYDNDPAWLAGEAAKAEFAVYLKQQIAYRRTHPGTDLISQLVQSEVAEALSEQAMLVNLRQLLFAGTKTTARWLGHALVTFGRYPEIRRAVNADRSILPNALEEILRWQGVTQVLPRGVAADGVVVEGIELSRGAEVLMLLGGANRDPERYDNPDELDIRRALRPHVAFGFGLHNCLGSALARMETREVLAVLLDRLPDYEITRPVDYGHMNARGPSEVWIGLNASA